MLVLGVLEIPSWGPPPSVTVLLLQPTSAQLGNMVALRSPWSEGSVPALVLQWRPSRYSEKILLFCTLLMAHLESSGLMLHWGFTSPPGVLLSPGMVLCLLGTTCTLFLTTLFFLSYSNWEHCLVSKSPEIGEEPCGAASQQSGCVLMGWDEEWCSHCIIQGSRGIIRVSGQY